MKKILLAFIVLLVGTTLFGQNTPPPQAFKYQAVVRDNAGQPMGGIDVSFQITIKEVSCSGTIVYQEEHVSIPTNDYGLVNLDIGTGTTSAIFDDIDWGGSSHYIDVSMDVNGGTDYTPMTCNELLSVPYALYAKESGGGPPGPAGPTTLLTTTVLPVGDTTCPAGGLFIESWVDSNSNGILDGPEAYQTVGHVCNGDPSTDNQQIDTMYIDKVPDPNSTGDSLTYLFIELENDNGYDSVLIDNNGSQ